MHNLLIGLGFVAMIVAPCVLAMRTGAENAEDA
jgi:hypothetical protein